MKNTKLSGAEFFRKYSNIIKEAEKSIAPLKFNMSGKLLENVNGGTIEQNIQWQKDFNNRVNLWIAKLKDEN